MVPAMTVREQLAIDERRREWLAEAAAASLVPSTPRRPAQQARTWSPSNLSVRLEWFTSLLRRPAHRPAESHGL